MRPYALFLLSCGASQNGAMTVHAQYNWQRRFAADKQRLERRRAHALEQAQEAVALAERTGPLSVDLKRIEDLSPDLLARLLLHSQEL